MRAAVSFLIALAVLVGAGPPSGAAEDRLGFSRDAVTWVSSLDQPLFDADARWVPGDRGSESFFVRNQSDDPAELAVDLLGTRIEASGSAGDLAIFARADGGAWQDVSSPGRQRVLAFEPMSAGEMRRVDVRVSFDADSLTRSHTLGGVPDLRVRLRQAFESPASAGHGPGSDGGLLPGTGGPGFWSLLAGMALAVSGLVVALRRRRHEQVDRHVR
jgi:LPXTG-motif cell wall-anchored protein